MKKLKRKIISLTIAALAFFGAGVFGLKSSATANAAGDVNYSAGLTMTEGAAICLSDEFQGIRWETTVKKHETLAEGNEAQFGVIVAPTKALTGDLTHNTKEVRVLDLAFPAGAIVADTANARYYSVVSYRELSKNLGAAYALDLTARAYVNVDGTYYYADISECDTSRSARSIAIYAELSGQLDEFRASEDANERAKADLAVAYYRAGDASKGQYVPEVSESGLNAGVVDLSSSSKSVKIDDFVVGDTIDGVYVGATSVPFTYEWNALTLTDVGTAPAGEHYATVFTVDGEIYTQPLIFATKILTKAEDLAMFHAKGVHSSSTTPNTLARNGEYCYDGYYVLGNNIDASSYVHGSKNYDGTFNTADWKDYTEYAGKTIGLRGTFNGMGYTIDGMTQGSVREGLFGMVNGGTVKNLAITNLKAGEFSGDMYALGKYLINATIENVYIQTNAYNKDDATNNPGFRIKKSAPLAYAAYNNTKIKNVVIDFQLTKDSNQSSAGKTSAGAALTISDATTSYTYENVYCVTPNKVRGAITNPTEAKKDQSFPLGLSHTTYVAASGETPATEGYFVWGANSEAKAFDGYVMTKAEGAYLYTDIADMYAAQKDNDAYKALANTGLWSVAEDGTLTWLERAALNPVNPEDEEEIPFPDTPVDPEDDLKILLIGNSHSKDTLWGVPQVANAQGVTNYTFGLAIRGGTTMESIVSLSESPSFQYFVSKPNADGTANEAYTKKNAQTLAYALTDQEWDYIFIQLGPWEPVVAGIYEDARETIVDFVHKKCPTARIGYSVSWLSPYEYAEGLSADYKNIYNASVELAGGKEDAYYRYEALLNNVKTSLYNDDGTPNGPHSMVLTVGTPIYYFTEVLGRPVNHLYGDNSKVHLREDYVGGVLAAYSFYTQFMYNIGAITECTVNMNTYNVIDDGAVVGTFDLTQQNNAPKSNIIEAINDMLENPWTVPGEAPEEPEPETPGAPETPVDPEPETPVDPKDDLKILLIGNSHSRDTFRGVPQVAIAQGVTNYTFGFAKISGTKMVDQVNNLDESVTSWEYFISEPSDNGVYRTEKDTTLNYILAQKEWDYVFIQLGPWDPIIKGIYETERNTVVSHIQTKCPNARIGYSVSWLSPYQDDAKTQENPDSVNMYNASVELAGGETTAYARYKALLNNVKTTLYNNDGTPKGPHSMVITVGTPVYYFTEVLKTGLTKVYNDPVHLRMDHIGGILASYSFYMQFMYNIGAITECKVEMNTYSTDTSGGTFDLTQSNNQPKKDIEEAINFMLENPWTVPGDETVESLEPAEGSLAASYKKILIVGNSHSQDVFLPLPEIFAAEGYNGYTIGTLMLAGSSAKDHVAAWGTAAYGFKISTNNSKYANQGEVSLQAALQAQQWDLVFMQNGPTDLAESKNSVDSGNRTTVEGYIKTYCPSAKLAYHLSWFGPYGDDPDEIQNSVVPEKGYGDVAMTADDYANYDPNSWKIDYRNPKTQHNKYCDLISNNILNNSNYVGAISTSAAVFYANQVLNRKAGTVADWKARNVDVLYRDELHMSDNGRILVSYAFFAQFMGVELTEIKLDTIIAGLRRQDDSADLTITDEWKTLILQSANWAKNNTWTHLS